MPLHLLMTDMGRHGNWLTLGDQTFVVRALNQTISRDFRNEQQALNHNASDKLNQPLAVGAKTKTVVWVQSKVSKK